MIVGLPNQSSAKLPVTADSDVLKVPSPCSTFTALVGRRSKQHARVQEIEPEGLCAGLGQCGRPQIGDGLDDGTAQEEGVRRDLVSWYGEFLSWLLFGNALAFLRLTCRSNQQFSNR